MKCTVNDFKKDNRIKLFGHEDAGKEKEYRLSEYFFKTNQFEDMCSDIDFQIITGEKGTGKSALLRIAFLESQKSGDVAIWIRMDDLSEIYSALRGEVDLYKLKTLWKKSICKLVVMRLADNCNITANEDYERALQWAYESGYARRDFISHTAKMLKPMYDKYVDTSVPSDVDVSEPKILERLIRKQIIRLYFDDFDLDWQGNSADVERIKSLILSLGDLTSDMENLSARIALRSDVYDMIRNEEFSDKFESAIIHCKWNNHQIIKALAKRICTYFKVSFDEDNTQDESTIQYSVQKYLDIVFEQKFDKNSRIWANAPISRVIFSLIRRKPRDMVKLCHNIAEYAYNKGLNKISGECFIAVLDSYSQERLRDIVNEYHNEMSELESVLIRLTPTQQEIREKVGERYVYTTSQLHSKIKNISQNIPIRIYNCKSEKPILADIHDVAHFLYRIGFITGRKFINGKISRVYFDESPFLLKKNVGDNGYSWEIHPAYRAALAIGIHDNWASTVSSEIEEE